MEKRKYMYEEDILNKKQSDGHGHSNKEKSIEKEEEVHN